MSACLCRSDATKHLKHTHTNTHTKNLRYIFHDNVWVQTIWSVSGDFCAHKICRNRIRLCVTFADVTLENVKKDSPRWQRGGGGELGRLPAAPSAGSPGQMGRDHPPGEWSVFTQNSSDSFLFLYFFITFFGLTNTWMKFQCSDKHPLLAPPTRSETTCSSCETVRTA